MVGSDPLGGWPRKGIRIDDKGKLVFDCSDDEYSNISFAEGEQLDPYHDV
jgi:PAS domain-containing protein